MPMVEKKELKNNLQLCAVVEPHHKAFTVPYAILKYAVKERESSAVQAYLAAKFIFSEKFFDKDVKTIARAIDQHPKSVKNHLARLVEYKWMGRDTRRGIYFIRGWDCIRKLLKNETKAGYRFSFSRIKDFKAFAIAATYDWLIVGQRWKLWREGRESRQKGCSKQTGPRSKGFYEVANSAYSQFFDVSEATASRYRKMAHEAGFLEVKEQLIPIPTDVQYDNRQVAEYWKEEYGKQLIFKNGRYYEQGISVVKSNLIRKKKPLTLGGKK